MASTKDLPEEIITQILYNVPAKPIGRFRSVSKGWLSLLTHPDFIKTHINTLNKHHLIFFTTNSNVNCPALYSNPYDDHHEPILRPADFESDIELRDLIICGSCNGLVLVFADSVGFSDRLVLLNPTTKESMKLPEIKDFDYLDPYEHVEFDCMYGLGYDSETGDFKVVSLTSLHHTIPMTDASIFVDVYSLKTNTWTRLTDSLDDYRSISPLPESVFVNGFLHWVTVKTVNCLRRAVILAFSLADEKFSEVPSPDFVESTEYLSSDHCRLVLLGGKLALFHETLGETWLMNEYGIKESWTKILLHGIHGIPMVIPDNGNYKPMVFYDDGKFMVANSDRMMVYDDEKGTFEETVCVWDPDNFKVNGSYVESLVSISSCIEE